MIVVDLGCHTHGDVDSIHHLIARFNPRLLYGFDAHPETLNGITQIGDTTVIAARRAAWIHDGTIGFHSDTTRSRVLADRSGKPISRRDADDSRVRCFDLAGWLWSLPADEIVLKCDIEGAEFAVLSKVHKTEADGLLSRILVEWHGAPLRRAFRCPVEEWTA